MIFLPYKLKTKIVGHLRRSYPLEGCGLLVGKTDPSGASVTGIAPSKNIAAEPQKSFEIDIEMHLNLQKQLRSNDHGEVVIGVYHSHPNGKPEPSLEDHISAIETSFIWLICSLTEDRFYKLAVFRFIDHYKGFRKLDLVLTEDPS